MIRTVLENYRTLNADEWLATLDALPDSVEQRHAVRLNAVRDGMLARQLQR